MQGDYSRWTFDPRQDYRSVLLQQGRVLLDADWNEQTELTRYHDEIRMLDTLGRTGGPASPDPNPTGPDNGGFAIVDAAENAPAGTSWDDLAITPGRYYVDGILCVARLSEGDTGPGIPLTDQPYLAAIGADPGLPEPVTGSRFALYLDVCTHEVTANEDPSLREPALGGPDTTTRARTVWQVRAVEISEDEACSDLSHPGWLSRTPGSMTAGLRETATDPDPCQISTTGGYTRLENQLYRVQIHDVIGGTARYLWSRENGSVIFGLVSIGTTTAAGMDAALTLDRVGRDEELSIREGDTIEITSTDFELRGRPGFLATAGAPDGFVLPVTWTADAPGSLDELGRNPVAKRWEHSARSVGTTPDDLEGGITVTFAGEDFRTGDFWLIPARTVRQLYGVTALAGTLEWPTDAARVPVPRPPLGPIHHIAPLAIFTRDEAGWTRLSDCRQFVPSLNQLVAIDLIGGDGQEATPGSELPQPIRFAVRNGGLPVQGARIRVSPHGGIVTDGTFQDAGIITSTDTDGVAAVRWTLDKDGAATQRLIAQRLDDHDLSIDVPIVVTGRLSQESARRPPGLHVIRAIFNNTGPDGLAIPFANDMTIKPADLAAGIIVTLDGHMKFNSVDDKPIAHVVIDLPWPMPAEKIIPTWNSLPFVGFRPIELDATVLSDGELLLWTPTQQTASWLRDDAFEGPGGLGTGLADANWNKPLLARFIIDGWAITGEENQALHLNGHGKTFIDTSGQTQMTLPTDDEVAGGQFIQWFRIEWRSE
jgi:hypothetical protein